MKQLTPRQTEVLEFIRAFHDKNGYGPTVRNIAHGLKFNYVESANAHVQALLRKKALTAQTSKSGRMVPYSLSPVQ